PRPASRPAWPSSRPVAQPNHDPDHRSRQTTNNPAAADRLRLAVVAVGVVVPVAVLVMCLCLPRRESAGTTKRPAGGQRLGAAVPGGIPVANRPDPVDRCNLEPPLPKEPPAEHLVAAVQQNVAPAPERGVRPPREVPVAPARVEKPLAAIVSPPRDDEPKLPV